MFPGLTTDEQTTVIDALRAAVGRHPDAKAATGEPMDRQSAGAAAR
jgi:hypothetical protein